jgi:hypothetical protein
MLVALSAKTWGKDPNPSKGASDSNPDRKGAHRGILSSSATPLAVVAFRRTMQIGLGLIASLALNSFPVAVSEAVCNEPHNGELFLHTLDEFVPRFQTTPIYGQLQKVQDFFVAEEGNRRPIALVMFGSSGVVHMVVELLADCFYGVQRGDYVSIINVKDVLQQSVHAENKTTDFDAARRLFKTRIKKAVASCPQRTVILLESVHTLTGELVRLLDVLLDPLNHERPLLDGVDCGGALVVLLMEGVPVLSTWRDTLEAQWSYKGVCILSRSFNRDSAIGLTPFCCVLGAQGKASLPVL